MQRDDVARPVRDSASQQRLERIDIEVVKLAASLGALDMRYAALIRQCTLERAGYPAAFPHLVLSASRVSAAGCRAEDPLALGHQEPSGWCLSPAVCYHVFAHLAQTRGDVGVALTTRGLCFRGEDHTEPGRRQIEFEMRELVFVGDEAWVEASAKAAADGIGALAGALGLRGTWEPAEDPFFLPAAQGKAVMQRLLGLKYEYRSACGLALASVNRHGTFFAERFDISLASGARAHSACVAVGLDRWHGLAAGVRDMEACDVHESAASL